MTTPSDVDFDWREEYVGLYGALENQRRRNHFVNSASRIALAILTMHMQHQTLTVKAVVAYVHENLVPQNGWKKTGPNRFDQAEHEQRVALVVTALKAEYPGEALIYVE